MATRTIRAILPDWPPAKHNREVLLDWAGLDDDAIDALEAAGVLADRPPA